MLRANAGESATFRQHEAVSTVYWRHSRNYREPNKTLKRIARKTRFDLVLALSFRGRIENHMNRESQHRRPGAGQKRPWFHFLLLWPIILDADKGKRNGRFLTHREWFGWGIVVVVVVLALVFT